MSRIRIFNPKSNHEILIDTTVSWVFFHPRTYEEQPYFEIKLLNGFNLSRHAMTCEDCGAFVNSLGTDTLDWYLEYSNTTYRLNLEKLGTETKLKYINSYYEWGTILQLRVHEIPVDIESLMQLRDSLVLEEKYERACVIRDLIDNSEKK